jgi:hypothetical protein
VGVPVMVMVLLFHEADNPVGNPDGVPIPVAPLVVNVISEGKAVLIQTEGVDEAAPTVFVCTVSEPVAVLLPHPPVSTME